MAPCKRRWPSLPAALLVPLTIGLGCMYDANPPEGAQQCYQGRCPDGYLCGVDGRCYTPSRLPAAAPGTGGTLSGVGGQTVAGNGGAGSGGIKGTGGKPGAGGVIGSGGVTGRGGSTVIGSGGAIGRGGVTGAEGGTTGSGGTTTSPNSGTTVTIANGQAQGAMTGFGWVALGALDEVTDPTCESPSGYITSGLFCDLTKWSMPNAYCVSGYIPVVGSSSEFTSNWGISLGINCTPVDGGPLGQAFSSLTIATSGSPATGLRVQVHRRGDPVDTSYCADMTPGVAVSFTSLNTACWDGTGTDLTAADVPTLDHIAVQVPSSMTSSITVTGLCITGITFK